MNREIKFRAWHIKDGKIYFDVPYSRKWECLPVPSNPYYGKIRYLGILSTNTAWEDDIFIMQFTGLKDATGTEQDEIIGKPLKEDYVLGVVEFHKGSFVAVMEGDNGERAGCEIEEDCIVLGNIYEHPELLK